MAGWLGSSELTAMFEDVSPVPQNDGPKAVVAIAYPQEYASLMNYFRAMLLSGERSPRVLELTAALVDHNAAHYTVWHVRRQCIFALGDADILREELEYAESVASVNPKNYQVWYHRRSVLERVGTVEAARAELEFIADVLRGDAKNYHGWSHRLWLLRQYPALCDGDEELEYLDGLLRQDAFNNSAWSHRHALVKQQMTRTASNVALRECEYALSFARLNPENESPWSYALSYARDDKGSFFLLREHCASVMKTSEVSAFAASTLLELYEREGELDYALGLAQQLETELDRPHRNFWINKTNRLKHKKKQQQH